MKIALAGAGAFGVKHLEGLARIDGVEVISLVGRELAKTQEIATKFGIKHVTTDLADSSDQGSGCGDPLHADANARSAGDCLHASGQACAG